MAFLLNLGFTVLEVIGGFLTNSVAILSDAVHDLGDTLSLGMAWYFDRLSRKGRTVRDTYGRRRYRLLGALITGVVLVVGIGFVLVHSAQRLADPGEVNVRGMIALAIIGVVVNGAAVLRVRRGTSLTERMVSWHLLEDTLGWVAVLIGAGVMAIYPWPIIDPLLAIGISLYVLLNVARNLRQVASVFLQQTPEGFSVEEFEAQAQTITGVLSLHHVHCWSIDGESHVLSAHIVVGSEAHATVIKNDVRSLLPTNAFEHVTLETESPDDQCRQREESDSSPTSES